MEKHKRAIQNLFLLLFAIISGLTISEVAAGKYVRAHKLVEKLNYSEGVAGSFGALPRFSLDKDLGWSLRPNIQRTRITSEFEIELCTNSIGIRDKEVSSEKPGTDFRIIALGESTVFGAGVKREDRFTEVIEDYLDNVEVINMGIPGYGADQSLLQLEKQGFQFHPDAVILFAINDFFERCKYVSRQGAVKPRFVLNSGKDGIFLQDIKLLTKTFNIPSPSEKITVKDPGKDKNSSFFAKSKLIFLLGYNKKTREINKRINDLDQERWLRISKDLEAGRKRIVTYENEDFRKLIYFILQKYSVICKEHGVDLVLVHMDIGDKLDLKTICQELNIKYLDLSRILSFASTIKPLRFRIDPHYNEFAHKVIGEHVGDYLEKEYSLRKAGDYKSQFIGNL